MNPDAVPADFTRRCVAWSLDAALVAWPPPDVDAPLPLDLVPLYEESLLLLRPAHSLEGELPRTLAERHRKLDGVWGGS